MGQPTKSLILPVTGMTCANCVRTVERSLLKTNGVVSANVNLSSERARVELQGDSVNIQELVARIEKAGYGIASGEADFLVNPLADDNDQRRLEKIILHQDGILSAVINQVNSRVKVKYIPTIIQQAEIKKIILDSGFQADELNGGLEDVEAMVRKREIDNQRNDLTIGLIFTIPLFLLSMAGDFNLLPMPWAHASWMKWLMFVLATPVQFYVGRSYYVGAYKSLRGFNANMDVLVAMGSSVAYIYSVFVILGFFSGHVYFETSAMIITLIKVGKFLEARARGRTSEAIKKLMGLKPKTAFIERNGAEIEIPVDDVQVDDIVFVHPGERFPVDGLVLEGHSFADESMISGEPMPVEKSPGKQVIGATINQLGLVKFKAQKVGRETALAQIIRLVEEAQGSKAPIQKLADQISSIFVPAVLALSLITFIVWYFVVPVPNISNADLFTRALINAVAVLVIACPCAMGLATPTAVMVATGKGAQYGVLFKSSEALERAGKVNMVLFDKTGTLTRGKPTVTDILPLSPSISSTELLLLAASVEKGSEHPLGQAVVSEAINRQLTLSSLEDFSAISGAGVEAMINNKKILVGSRRLMSERGLDMEPFQEKNEKFQKEGKTTFFVAIDGKAAGLITIADQIKKDTPQAIQALKNMGVRVAMITGDNAITAAAIGTQSGIEQVLSEVLPSDKNAEIKKIQQQGYLAAMVGDGINDAPALAQADVGIAIGTGTDIAISTAPVVLVSGDIMGVAHAIHLSRRTLRTIKENLFWAFFYNIILIPAAAAGLLNPMLAAGAMAFSSIFVVTNSLRLKNLRL